MIDFSSGRSTHTSTEGGGKNGRETRWGKKKEDGENTNEQNAMSYQLSYVLNVHWHFSRMGFMCYRTSNKKEPKKIGFATFWRWQMWSWFRYRCLVVDMECERWLGCYWFGSDNAVDTLNVIICSKKKSNYSTAKMYGLFWWINYNSSSYSLEIIGTFSKLSMYCIIQLSNEASITYVLHLHMYS